MRTGVNFRDLPLPLARFTCATRVTPARARGRRIASPLPISASRIAELAAVTVFLPPRPRLAKLPPPHVGTARFVASIVAALGLLVAFLLAVHR